MSLKALSPATQTSEPLYTASWQRVGQLFLQL